MMRRAPTRLFTSIVFGMLLGFFSNSVRADTPLSVGIPAQTVDAALAEFARLTGLQLVYLSNLTQARASQGARAGVSASVALTELLEGTGLSFQFLNDRTVRIFEVEPVSPAALPKTASAAKPHQGSRVPGLGKSEEQITVTALRGAGDLSDAAEVQSVAESVSMVSGYRLEAQKLEQLSDYAAYLPGLNLELGAVPSFVLVQLRGIGAMGNAPTVAYAIDEAPIGPTGNLAGFQAAPDLIPYDLERIEVRRGPQGTLGGAGSESGLIRYVLNEPNVSEFEARVGTSVSATHYASKPGASLEAMVNAPVVENTLAVRVSAYDTYRPGFIDNVYSGATDVNVFRRYGGRISALWHPAESLSLKVTALWNRIDADSSDLALSAAVLPLWIPVMPPSSRVRIPGASCTRTQPSCRRIRRTLTSMRRPCTGTPALSRSSPPRLGRAAYDILPSIQPRIPTARFRDFRISKATRASRNLARNVTSPRRTKGVSIGCWAVFSLTSALRTAWPSTHSTAATSR